MANDIIYVDHSYELYEHWHNYFYHRITDYEIQTNPQ